jgi:hypothetical protein
MSVLYINIDRGVDGSLLCCDPLDHGLEGKELSTSEDTNCRSELTNAAEDDGVLVFTVLNGATNTSSFITVDARTMKTVGNATVPDTIGFTTHGQFYQHLKK